MNFHNFQSLIGSRKAVFEMKATTDSFAIANERKPPYIEPTFTKNEFDLEKPQVLLISAVGATGKSALAEVLSNRLRLPLLSLGRHKPVGDNTLTGLLTTSFAVDHLSALFQRLSSGEYPSSTPQQPNEPWSSVCTRQNSFDWQKKQQEK